MKVAKGNSYTKKVSQKDPSNALIFVLQNYRDFVELVFNEDAAKYKVRKGLKSKRLSYLDKADKKSPYYLFSKGVIHLQWSIIELKYGDYLSGALDFRKSYALFKENVNKYPKFKYNKIFYGAQMAIAGTIPDGYKLIAKTLGLRGNIKSGMRMLESTVDLNKSMFQNDAILYSVYLKQYIENKPKDALALIDKWKLDTKNNHLFTFMAANLNLNNFKAGKSIQIIQSRNKSKEFMPMPILDYELGLSKLGLLEYDGAIYSLNRYVNSKVLFYKKDACQKIAIAYYLKGNTAKANAYKAKIRTAGNTETDLDKQALRFSKSGSFGNKNLLKARMLFDGGEFSRAQKILNQIDTISLSTDVEKLEFIYRKGRVLEGLKQRTAAIKAYKETLAQSNPTNEYYHARAALQAAGLYEEMGQVSKALIFYKKVLSLKGHEFKNSLDHRAKTAILRLGGK